MTGALLAFAALLAVFNLAWGMDRLADKLEDLRLWVTAHDDELSELAEGDRRQELVTRLRQRQEPVGRWTE